MPIVEDQNQENSESVINIEKIKEVFSLYKFPLVLAGIGVLFLILGIIYTVKTQNFTQEVVFSSESSPSGNIGKTKIQVDVEGAIASPGVYEVEEGTRITAVLASAGGLSASADRDWVSKNMNLAMKVTDGGKIYIPSAGEMTAEKITNEVTNVSGNSGQLLGVTTGKVNINTASQVELEGLPGIGPVTAGKIISGRPYQSVDELKSKKAVGQAVFEKIKDLIVAF